MSAIGRKRTFVRLRNSKQATKMTDAKELLRQLQELAHAEQREALFAAGETGARDRRSGRSRKPSTIILEQVAAIKRHKKLMQERGEREGGAP